mgnify:CR=1 FL=1
MSQTITLTTQDNLTIDAGIIKDFNTGGPSIPPIEIPDPEDPETPNPEDPETPEISPGATASIGDTVWHDTDADGVQDRGEIGVV